MILLFGLIALKFSKFVKKHFKWIGLLAVALSLASYMSQNLHLPTNSGELGMAFFILVMFQSAFKKGSPLYKKLLALRKEYSILGFIFLMPHALTYLIGEFQYLEWQGILSFLIMVPLFITSFIGIRKRMTVKHWRLLHVAAYPAYILMFAHVIFVGETMSRLLYTAIALVYLLLKLKNKGFEKVKKANLQLGLLLVLLGVMAFNVYSISSSQTIDYIDMTEKILLDGVYEGEGQGFKGMKVQVEVEVKKGQIHDIRLISTGTTGPNHGMNYEQAVIQVKDAILADQSLEVDTVSGATISTTGLKEAVNDALSKASQE